MSRRMVLGRTPAKPGISGKLPQVLLTREYAHVLNMKVGGLDTPVAAEAWSLSAEDHHQLSHAYRRIEIPPKAVQEYHD